MSAATSVASSPREEGLADIGGTRHSDDDGGDGRGIPIPTWKERIDTSVARSRKIRGANYVQISTVDYGTMEPRCRTVVFRGFLKGVPSGAVRNVVSGDGSDGVEEAGGQKGGGDQGRNYDCVMKMITDARSNKVRELNTCHAAKNRARAADTAEMVWWFPKSSEQYRIRGRLQFIGSNGPLHAYADALDTDAEKHNGYFLAERKQQWGNLSDTAREQFYWETPGAPCASALSVSAGIPPGGRDGDGKVLPAPDTFLLMLLYPTKIDYLRLSDNYRQIDEWKGGGGASRGCWKSTRVNP